MLSRNSELFFLERTFSRLYQNKSHQTNWYWAEVMWSVTILRNREEACMQLTVNNAPTDSGFGRSSQFSASNDFIPVLLEEAKMLDPTWKRALLTLACLRRIPKHKPPSVVASSSCHKTKQKNVGQWYHVILHKVGKKISARILKAFDGPVPPDRRRGQPFIRIWPARTLQKFLVVLRSTNSKLIIADIYYTRPSGPYDFFFAVFKEKGIFLVLIMHACHQLWSNWWVMLQATSCRIEREASRKNQGDILYCIISGGTERK